MKKIFIILFFIFSFSFSYDKMVACLQYKQNHSWQKKYKVTGLMYKGSESITRNYSFDIFEYYYVVFWNNKEVSIIKIDDIYFGGKIMFDLNGVDQNGIKWKISSKDFCY